MATETQVHRDKLRAARWCTSAGFASIAAGLVGGMFYGGKKLSEYFDSISSSMQTHLGGHQVQLLAAEHSTTGSSWSDLLHVAATVAVGVVAVGVGTRFTNRLVEQSAEDTGVLRETQPALTLVQPPESRARFGRIPLQHVNLQAA